MRELVVPIVLIGLCCCAAPPSTQGHVVEEAGEIPTEDCPSIEHNSPDKHCQERQRAISHMVQQVGETKNTTDCILTYLEDQRAQMDDPSLQSWDQPKLADYETDGCRSKIPRKEEDVHEAKPEKDDGGKRP